MRHRKFCDKMLGRTQKDSVSESGVRYFEKKSKQFSLYYSDHPVIGSRNHGNRHNRRRRQRPSGQRAVLFLKRRPRYRPRSRRSLTSANPQAKRQAFPICTAALLLWLTELSGCLSTQFCFPECCISFSLLYASFWRYSSPPPSGRAARRFSPYRP